MTMSAATGVYKVRTFVRVKLGAVCASLTIMYLPECLAIWSRGVDVNVGETTVVPVATAEHIILTRRGVVG
jgi:hypothetical protein